MHNEILNKRSLAIAAVAVMLLSTTLMSITAKSDSAFARKYGRHDASDVSQSAFVSNTCLNPVSNSNINDNMISNGNCGGTVSQHDKSGQASTPTTMQTANPTIEVQRQSTTAQPPLTTTRGNCTACFDPLTPGQKSDFESVVHSRFSTVFPGTNITTIEQLCTFLENIVLQGEDPIEATELIQSILTEEVEGVSPGTASNITSCVLRAVE
jgi:hypothetical protein